MESTETNNTLSRSSPSWLFIAAIFAVCISGLAAFGFQQQPLDPLSEMLAELGKPEVMPPSAAKFFKVPGDPVQLRELSKKSASGRLRSAQLLTQTGDIFLIEQPADNSRTYFYRTNRRGKLMLACYLNSDLEMHPIDDVQDRFEKEKDFWLTYQREQTKHEAK